MSDITGKIFTLKEPIPGKPDTVEVIEDHYIVKCKSVDGIHFMRREKLLKWYYSEEGLQSEMFPKPKPFQMIRSKVRFK